MSPIALLEHVQFGHDDVIVDVTPTPADSVDGDHTSIVFVYKDEPVPIEEQP